MARSYLTVAFVAAAFLAACSPAPTTETPVAETTVAETTAPVAVDIVETEGQRLVRYAVDRRGSRRPG